MKQKTMFVIAALSLLTITSAAQATVLTKEITVSISDAYIPGGFDSEADSYVVVNGLFPNGCYSWKGALVNHLTNTTHEIQSKATVRQGGCIMVLVPFSKEVRLGKLQSGNHLLRFLNGDGTYLEKNMHIE